MPCVPTVLFRCRCLALTIVLCMQMLLGGDSAFAQPYGIPDSPGPTAGTFGPPLTFHATTTDTGMLTGLNSVTINMSHTWVGDLRIRLVYTPARGAGAGVPVTVPILTRVGVPVDDPGAEGDGSNLNGTYTFADNGADAWDQLLSLPSDAALPAGTYRPFGPGNAPVSFADALDGLSAAGVWQFTFDDAYPGDMGAVTSVSFSRNLSPCIDDPTWTSTGAFPQGPNAQIRALAMMPNGDVIAGGDFFWNVAVRGVARYSPNTGQWSTLGYDPGFNNAVHAVTVLPDGGVIVGGDFTVPSRYLAQFDAHPDGWGPLETGTTGPVRALLTMPDGDVIVGGEFGNAVGVPNTRLIARYRPSSGQWFSLGGVTSPVGGLAVKALALAPTGEVIVGGDFSISGADSPNIARYNPTTDTWSALGYGLTNKPLAVGVLSTGKVIAGGLEFVRVFDPVTNAWSSVSGAMSGAVNTLCILPNDDVIVGGTFSQIGGGSFSRIARYDPSTNTWTSIGNVDGQSVLTLIRSAAGDVFAGGDFASIGGVPSRNFARFGAAFGPFTITSQPESGFICGDGSDVQISVAASSPADLSFQWRKNGVAIYPVTNPSAATSTLILDDADATDVGDYDCVVATECSSVTSQSATLSLSNPVTITASPESIERCLNNGQPVEFVMEAESTLPILYRWERNGVAIDPVVNPSAATPRLTIMQPTAADSATYVGVAYNECFEERTTPATLSIDSPPVITQQPASVAACSGSGLPTFSVVVSGCSPFTYQWRRNSQVINAAAFPSAATASLVLFANTGDTGQYDCVVSNPYGSVISDAVSLEPETNWAFSSRHPAGAVASTINGADLDQQVGVVTVGAVNRASLWGSAFPRVDLHPTGATSSVASAIGDGQQSGAAVFGGVLHAGMWTGSAATWIDLHPAGATESHAYGVRGGEQVGYAAIAGANRASLWTGSAASRVDLHPAGASHSIAYATGDGQQAGVALINGGLRACFWQGNAGSWIDLQDLAPTQSVAYGVGGGRQVGYATIAGVNRASVWNGGPFTRVNLHPTGATESTAYATDAFMQVGYATFNGEKHAGLWYDSSASWVDLDAYLPAAYSHSVANAMTNDGCNTIIAGYAFNTQAGRNEAITWMAPSCTAPNISSHPVSQVVCNGEQVSFSVSAQSGFALSYQWRKNGADIDADLNPSAATHTLVLSGVNATDIGAYSCVVTGGCGRRVSGDATLVVYPPGTIACARRQPSGTVVTVNNVRIASAVDVNSSTTQHSFTIEDDSGALTVTVLNATAAAIINAATAGGNNVLASITGSVLISNGLTQLTTITAAVPANAYLAPTITTITADDLASSTTAEGLESRIVRISDYVFTQSGAFAVANYTNGNPPFVARIPTAAIAAEMNAAFAGAIPTSRPVQLTGILSQFETTAPYDDGYLLLITSVVECPAINVQPMDAVACRGAAEFSVSVTGSGPLSYQWFAHGVPIDAGANPSAAAATLVLAGVQNADAGDYECVVSNECGSITSGLASLTACAGDWNCVDSLDSQDFFDFLEGFFNGDADFNGFDGTDSQDYFDFLEAFFVGCQ